MAYFDSEKNKAMWQRHLLELKKEKDRRKENGYKPVPKSSNLVQHDQASEVRPGVRIITFEELIAKEQERHRARRVGQREKEMSLGREMEKAPKAL